MLVDVAELEREYYARRSAVGAIELR